MQLEDGEIPDDGDNEIDPYTPLERPYYSCASAVIGSDEEEDENEFNANCSSEDEDVLPTKRLKLKPQAPLVAPERKKYNIWCKDPNVHLTDILGNINVTHSRIERSVESYTVPEGHIIYNKWKRKLPKGLQYQCKRKNSKKSENSSSDSLEINDLETNDENSEEEVAFDIATKLSEPNMDLVLRIVMMIGKSKAIEFFKKTQEIERDGGMLILNRSRRRTSGGLFMHLVRTDSCLSESMVRQIFLPNIGKRKPRFGKKKRKCKVSDEEKDEFGQEVLSNPPPSPVSGSPLPELPLRRDLVMYEDLNMDLI